MVKVLVVFGSKSDEEVYKRVVRGLKSGNIDVELRIASAHKTPDELNEIINTDADLIIAGAGLSAALPGVIASRTIKPVIGIPVSNNYQGLDALLSIMQMPPGVPVLGVGVNQAEMAVRNAIKLTRSYVEINLVSETHNRALEKAKSLLEEFDIKYRESESVEKDAVNIEFVSLDESVPEKDPLVIYCPVMDEGDIKAEAALNVLRHTTHGLWVGLNNGVNAALAAIEILNSNGAYEKQLYEYRKKIKDKVISSDEEVKNA